jgi:hypothetical protein
MRRIAVALALFLAATLCAAAQPAKKAQGNAQGCDLANAETIVHGIKLADGDSTKKVLGADYRSIWSDPKSDYAWMIFASRDNKQLLMMRHHAGDTVDSYMEFEVKFGRHDRKPKNLPVYEFITGKGVKLGMKRKAVLAKFGPCFKSVTHGETETVRYEITDERAAAGILKGANMPQYYAEYEFRGGILIRFKFGHEPV